MSSEDEIKEIIKNYIDIETKIKEFSKDIKELKQTKKDQEEYLLEFLKSRNLQEITLKNGSKIKLVKSSVKEPLNKDFLVTALSEEFNLDEAKAVEIYDKIDNKRSVSEKECVKKLK